jgi:hypothetical protein
MAGSAFTAIHHDAPSSLGAVEMCYAVDRR